MISRGLLFDGDTTDMGFVGTGAKNPRLHLSRLLSRELADSRGVNPAPSETNAAPRQQTHIQYRPTHQLTGPVDRLSVAGRRCGNLGRKERFTVDHHRTAAVSYQVFSVQIASTKQTHYGQAFADAAIEAHELVTVLCVPMRYKLDPPIVATIDRLGYANTQWRSVFLGDLR
jgi:hypothetical protein